MKSLLVTGLLTTGCFAGQAQNVGINTTTPLAPLHIKNDNEVLRFQGTTPFLSFYDNAGTTLKEFIQQYNNNFFLVRQAVIPMGICNFI